jgi:phosphatidate cytidylyltransferase
MANQRLITGLAAAGVFIPILFLAPCVVLFMLLGGVLLKWGADEWGYLSRCEGQIFIVFRGLLLGLLLLSWGSVRGFSLMAFPLLSHWMSHLVAGILWVFVGGWFFLFYCLYCYPNSRDWFFKAMPHRFVGGLVILGSLFHGGLVMYQFGGVFLLFQVILLVWCVDSCAFFGGQALGQHALIPAVSPHKTWEGVISGLLGAMVLGVVLFFVSPGMARWGWGKAFFSFEFWVLGVWMVAVIAVLGDLVESMFKRASGVKDSGRLFPGHGGLLDRIDSLSAVLVFFAVFYLSFI